MQWMVVEARHLKDLIVGGNDVNAIVHAFTRSGNPETTQNRTPVQSAKALIEVTDALSTFGYDQAANEVYGVTYPEWKKRHQKKATEEQL